MAKLQSWGFKNVDYLLISVSLWPKHVVPVRIPSRLQLKMLIFLLGIIIIIIGDLKACISLDVVLIRLKYLIERITNNIL